MLSVAILSVIMLSVVMLSVIVLNVAAPLSDVSHETLIHIERQLKMPLQLMRIRRMDQGQMKKKFFITMRKV
jgi:hypothetical protein